jgi:acetoacetyl-CoA synthetase
LRSKPSEKRRSRYRIRTRRARDPARAPTRVALEDSQRKCIMKQIRAKTTSRDVPAKILQVADIPRTISGKITEIAVRDTIHGLPVKNTDALANPAALALYSDLPELR